MADRNQTEDGQSIDPVNIGNPNLPPDMTDRTLARRQGFDPDGPSVREEVERSGGE